MDSVVEVIANIPVVMGGKEVRILRLKEEWDDEILDPENFMAQLQKTGANPDIFTFIQRVPESRPKFDYAYEWDNFAVLPIETYECWWNRQITQEARNKIRKGFKKGLTVNRVDLNGDLVKSITEIYNETPVRQGKFFKDYGKNSEYFYKAYATFPDRSHFMAAYLDDEFVGFIRVVTTDKYARIMGILSKTAYRNCSINNVLVAEAVKCCAELEVPYLIYAKYSYGKWGSPSLQKFKWSNGFENVIIPRYFVPLSGKGRLALITGLHHGIKNLLPHTVIHLVARLRERHYRRKYANILAP